MAAQAVRVGNDTTPPDRTRLTGPLANYCAMLERLQKTGERCYKHSPIPANGSKIVLAANEEGDWMRATTPIGCMLALASLSAAPSSAAAQRVGATAEYGVIEREANNSECANRACQRSGPERSNSQIVRTLRGEAAVANSSTVSFGMAGRTSHADTSGTRTEVFHGDYKGLRVWVTGTETFRYIRSDYFQAIGGVQGVLQSPTLTPYPVGRIVKVRKGADYYIVWVCQANPKQSLVTVANSTAQEQTVQRCQ